MGSGDLGLGKEVGGCASRVLVMVLLEGAGLLLIEVLERIG